MILGGLTHGSAPLHIHDGDGSMPIQFPIGPIQGGRAPTLSAVERASRPSEMTLFRKCFPSASEVAPLSSLYTEEVSPRWCSLSVSTFSDGKDSTFHVVMHVPLPSSRLFSSGDHAHVSSLLTTLPGLRPLRSRQPPRLQTPKPQPSAGCMEPPTRTAHFGLG